jgi:hypothetical protein
MVKLDLHTHSQASYDAIITLEDLEAAFAAGKLDQLAITDHDEINFAKSAQKHFGEDKIIVGEEITTAEKKHIIGLFLTKFVPRGLSAQRTCELIRNQNGLVYIPHPLEPKWGVGSEILSDLIEKGFVDILEGFNGWNKWLIIARGSRKAQNDMSWKLAEEHGLAVAASTDSHTAHTLGNAYSGIAEVATRQNLVQQLKALSVEDYKRDYNNLGLPEFRAGFKSITGR